MPYSSYSRVMVLLKLLIYCLLAYLAIRFVRKLLAGAPGGASRATPRDPRPAQMIRCENCGMFITQTSALLIGGRGFCSKSCAQKVNRV